MRETITRTDETRRLVAATDVWTLWQTNLGMPIFVGSDEREVSLAGIAVSYNCREQLITTVEKHEDEFRITQYDPQKPIESEDSAHMKLAFEVDMDTVGAPRSVCCVTHSAIGGLHVMVGTKNGWCVLYRDSDRKVLIVDALDDPVTAISFIPLGPYFHVQDRRGKMVRLERTVMSVTP